MNYLESWGTAFCNQLAHILMFVLNPGHQRGEVDGRKMQSKGPSELLESVNDDVEDDVAVEAGRLLYEIEEERLKVVSEKSKVLLTVCALFFAAVVAVSGRIEYAWVVVLPLLPMFAAIFLILLHFGVQTYDVPDCSAMLSQKSDRAAFAIEFVNAARKNHPRNNFQVGVYRAAARAVTLGTALMFVPIGTLIFFPKETGVNSVPEEQNEPGVIELLQFMREGKTLGVPAALVPADSSLGIRLATGESEKEEELGSWTTRVFRVELSGR